MAMVMSVSSASVSSLMPPTRSRAERRKAPTAPGMVGMQREHVVHPAVEVEAHHVLDVLPGADQRVPVADLRVARDGADARVAEGLHQFADGGRFEDRVAVHHHDEVVTGVGYAAVEGGGLARVVLAYDADVRQAQALDDQRGAVASSRRR